MKKGDLFIITGMGLLAGTYGKMVRMSPTTGGATLELLEDCGAFKAGETVNIGTGEWLYVAPAPFSFPPPTLFSGYFKAKANLPASAILLLRLGDFYEVLGNDAEACAKATTSALTNRFGVPMWGAPYHAINRYCADIASATGREVWLSDMGKVQHWQSAAK